MGMTWTHLFILVLASFRLTHLLVYDKITSFIRRPFIENTSEEDKNGEIHQIVRIKGTGIKYWIGSLLSCHWCTGVWSAAIVVLIYLYLPYSVIFLLILAVSGAASIIESFIP